MGVYGSFFLRYINCLLLILFINPIYYLRLIVQLFLRLRLFGLLVKAFGFVTPVVVKSNNILRSKRNRFFKLYKVN